MKFNLICRIADDKNFFADLIFAVYQAKIKHNIIAEVNFIGAIENDGIYRTLVRTIEMLEISSQMNFTKKSIRYEDMSEDMKKGYFINFSVGNFVGYSSIECMKFNLKTIFYNVDKNYEEIMNPNQKCFCSNLESLVSLINFINSDEKLFDEIVQSENQKLLSDYLLTDAESDLLVSLLKSS